MDIEMSVTYSGFIDDKYLICTDKHRLQQVLQNFQSNAIKFTRRGGKINIDVCIKPDEGQNGVIEISIKDNGVGIKEEDQGKLF